MEEPADDPTARDASERTAGQRKAAGRDRRDNPKATPMPMPFFPARRRSLKAFTTGADGR
jgi:hypothetical protein